MQVFSLLSTHCNGKVVHQMGYSKGVGMREMVKCQICGVERRRLGAHIKASHEMTTAEYQAKFPGVPVEVLGSRKRSAECRAKQSAAASKRWSDPDERVAQSKRLKDSAPWAGKPLSEDHKAAISAGGLGVAHNLTDEYRREVGERGRLALAEIRQRPDHRAKLSAGQVRRQKRGDIVGFQIPGVWQKGFETRLRNGTLIPPGGGRGITGFRKGLVHYCRSTLEANFARILAHEGVPYEYEPKVFRLPNGSRWTPDFRLLAPLGSIPAGWVELKGWRKKDGSFAGGASMKIQAFEQMTGEAVYVLVQSSPEWRALRDRYSSEVPWEKPRFNLRTHPKMFGRNS